MEDDREATGPAGGPVKGDYSAPGLEREDGREPEPRGGVDSGGDRAHATPRTPAPPVASTPTPPESVTAGGAVGGTERPAAQAPQGPTAHASRPAAAAPGAGPGREVHGAPPSGLPPSGLPPIPPGAGGGKGGGAGRTFFVALIAAMIGALLVLLLMPWGFGVNPWDIIRGRLRQTVRDAERGQRAEVVKVVSPTEGAVSVTKTAQKVTPAIVNIDIRTAPQRGFFFDTGEEEGVGSGVIYTEDGYILTNNHVVKDAQEITVTLASGERLKGTRVGADPENDIAVVKVDKAGLPTLRLGDSDNLKVGELAVAVGSPFGFEQSVTAGIVSALHRTLSVPSLTGEPSVVLTDLIQTDAPINPGNSGGALCDSQARLIGINAAIASASGASAGVGFAIPINTARRVADDIIAGRPVSHPYIGVLGQSVSRSIAEEYDLPVDEGAYITRVVPDGPADKAGMRSGDIIVKMGGKPVRGMDDVIAAVRSRKVGDKVSVTYYSGTNRKTTEVTLEEKPRSLQ